MPLRPGVFRCCCFKKASQGCTQKWILELLWWVGVGWRDRVPLSKSVQRQIFTLQTFQNAAPTLLPSLLPCGQLQVGNGWGINAPLPQHIRKVHKRKLASDVVAHTICPKSKQQFAQQRKSNNHILICGTQDRPFPCDKCEQTFRSTDQLQVHKKQTQSHNRIP